MTSSDSVGVRSIDAAQVPALVQAMFDPRRRHSLTIVSPAGDVRRPRIDVDKLVSLVVELPTDIVVLADMDTSTRLSDSVPDSFRCFGGSVRVVMPGAKVTDHYRRHPQVFIYPEDDPQVALHRIVQAAERTPPPPADAPAPASAARPVSRPVVPSLPAHLIPKPGPRPVVPAHPTVPSEAGGNEAGDREATAAASTEPSTPPTAPAPGQLPFGLADIEAVVERAVARTIEEQLGGPSDDLARERSRADTAEEQLSEALQRIRHLETQKPAPTPVISPGQLPKVYVDREKQLRWEVETTWLTTIPERERGPLPTWTLDPEVLDGLELQVVPRTKTIEVMIAILHGDWETRFGGHQAKESEGGPYKVSPDGTPMWRTYIKENTPQAPRLSWWHTKSGGVHFHHVGGHDDLL